jgi:hypothetical protein
MMSIEEKLNPIKRQVETWLKEKILISQEKSEESIQQES